MDIDAFYQIGAEEQKSLLAECCGSGKWIQKMVDAPAVSHVSQLLALAEEKWKECNEADWKEAFKHHPKIGDIDALRKKFAADRFAANEQGAVSNASEQTIKKLSEANDLYEKKFGYIFIVCATGKSGNEMLKLLEKRLKNDPEQEIQIAKEEQFKITKLRLEKLFSA